MPEGTAGPELAAVGSELTNPPEAAPELERAAAALESMAQQVQGLMTELQKEQERPTISLEAEKATTAAAMLREVAERAASLAKALEAAKEPDMGKLSKEVGALVKVLQGITEKYPYPKPKSAAKGEGADPEAEPGQEPAEPQPEPAKPTFGFKTVAEKSLGMAAKLATAKEVDDEIRTGIEDVLKSMTELAQALKVEKAEVEPDLPEIFSAEEPEDKAIIKAMEGILRNVTERLNSVAKMVEGEEVSDAVKAEVNLLQATLTKAGGRLPTKTTKASKHLTATLKDVAGRALNLSQRAEKAKVSDEKLVREMQGINKMIEALVEKYSGVKKAEDFELSDLGQILNADRLLSEFEAQLAKLETPAPAADPPAQDPAPDSPAVGDLQAKIEALSGQLKELQTAVAKARETVDPPAAGGQDPDPAAGGGKEGAFLFPQDYNDPVYQEELKKRGLE